MSASSPTSVTSRRMTRWSSAPRGSSAESTCSPTWRRCSADAGSLDEVTEDDWDLQHDINLKSAFFLARAAGRAMIEAGNGGRIILFSSQGWWTGGFGGSVAYASTKGGVTTMCRGLARTFGPHQITVNCVSPGQVNTPMLMTGLAPEIYESMKKQTPLGYVAEPEELAGPVVFLASDHAKYITGATLNVSGGFLMY